MKILSRGAEAIIYVENNKVIKKRLWKKYRIKELNEKIIRERTKLEVRILRKCLEIGLKVPKVYSYDLNEGIIVMEFINGIKLSDYIDNSTDFFGLKNIFKNIGKLIAKMHNSNIIHNDLTTSNIIVKDNNIYFIDFGLSIFSSRIEDKAVDLHLLYQSLKSRHTKYSRDLFLSFLEGYKIVSYDYKEVVSRLRKIEERGRYKER